MATSLFHTTKYKVISAIFWFALSALHAMVLTRFDFTVKMAIYDSLVSNILLAATSLLITLTFQYYNPHRNRYIYIISLVGVLSILWLLISRSMLMPVIEAVDYDHFFSQSFIIRLVFGILVTGCMALISVLWYTIQDQQESSQRKTEAEKLSKEAELFKLRQQLQPHFLFNSLNSINALIGTQPQQARTMIQQLGDFLRSTLKKEEHQWVSLEEELQHLQLYLDIEKVRFGYRLKTEIINTANGTNIPALLLQPILENAIKFGLYDTIGEIAIRLEAWKENNDLKVQVKNPFDEESSSQKKGTGFGLSSVNRRLFLLFERSNLLQTSFEDGYFITTITIPQQ